MPSYTFSSQQEFECACTTVGDCCNAFEKPLLLLKIYVLICTIETSTFHFPFLVKMSLDETAAEKNMKVSDTKENFVKIQGTGGL